MRQEPTPSPELPLGQPLHRAEVRQLVDRLLSGEGFILREHGEGSFELVTPARDGSWQSVAVRHPTGATRRTFTRAEVLGYVEERSPGRFADTR